MSILNIFDLYRLYVCMYMYTYIGLIIHGRCIDVASNKNERILNMHFEALSIKKHGADQ
jgi:hypothetical protein